MAGYLVLGAGFGMLLQSRGFGLPWALCMSLFIYAGSMQYVCIELMSAGAPLLTALLMTVAVNIRHLFYGIAMLEPYRDMGARKPYLVCALTDETFSLVCSPRLPEEVSPRDYYLAVSLLDHLYWVAGSAAGSLLGSVLGVSTEGIDFAMTALFLVIVLEQWEKTREHRPALTGLIISAACLALFGADGFLIPAMLLITAALFLERPLIEKEGEP